MKEQNHEYYVSLEVAKLLKKAGFDWKVMPFYTNDISEGCESEYELRLVKFDNWNGKNKTWCDLVSAPTLEVAQRWLREVKGYSIYPTRGGYKIYVLDINDSIGFSRTYELNSNLTYEESQEAAIKKVLEIILEKGK